MPYSMTGFGRAEHENDKGRITVEINTVNSRFLDFQIRMPRSFSPLENDIKTLLTTKFNRGKVVVNISIDNNSVPEQISLDEEKVESYLKIYDLLKEKFNLSGDLSFREFVSLPDLIKLEKADEDLEEVWKVLKATVETAADQVLEMRKNEGSNLAKDMIERAAVLKKVLAEIEKLAPENVKEYKTKLEERILKILNDSPVDQQRLATEVAMFADKSDITEECIRFRSHLEQLEESLSSGKPIGKKLNFIMQELNREANTTGSKALHYEISKRVISIKEEIERLREQIQNIE